MNDLTGSKREFIKMILSELKRDREQDYYGRSPVHIRIYCVHWLTAQHRHFASTAGHVKAISRLLDSIFLSKGRLLSTLPTVSTAH